MPEFIKRFLGNPWSLRVEEGGGGGGGGGGDDPPAGDPPAGDPPAGDPPAGDPPPATPAEFNWRGKLGDDLQQDAVLANFGDDEKGLGDLAKSYASLRRKYSGYIPKPDPADQEAMGEIYNALGRPETAEGYNFEHAIAEVEVPEGFNPAGDGLFEDLRPAFHELGLSKEQAEGLARIVTERQAEGYKARMAEYQAANHQATEALREEWGDDYDANVADIQATFNAFSKSWPPEAKVLFLSQAGNDSEVLKSFLAFSRTIAEDSSLEGNRERTTGISPTEAKRQLAELNAQMSDAKSPLRDKYHPQHAETIKKRTELYALAYPEQ